MIDEVLAAAADLPAQQAVPLDSADAEAKQTPAGDVSSLPADSMLNKPANEAVKSVQDQEQKAPGGGTYPAAAVANTTQSRGKDKKADKSLATAEEAVIDHRNAAASSGPVQPVEGEVYIYTLRQPLDILKYATGSLIF